LGEKDKPAYSPKKKVCQRKKKGGRPKVMFFPSTQGKKNVVRSPEPPSLGKRDQKKGTPESFGRLHNTKGLHSFRRRPFSRRGEEFPTEKKGGLIKTT